MDAQRRFERYVERLSDDDALVLHKVVSRRAAHIFEPLYRAKREANYRMGTAAARAKGRN